MRNATRDNSVSVRGVIAECCEYRSIQTVREKYWHQKLCAKVKRTPKVASLHDAVFYIQPVTSALDDENFGRNEITMKRSLPHRQRGVEVRAVVEDKIKISAVKPSVAFEHC